MVAIVASESKSKSPCFELHQRYSKSSYCTRAHGDNAIYGRCPSPIFLPVTV